MLTEAKCAASVFLFGDNFFLDFLCVILQSAILVCLPKTGIQMLQEVDVVFVLWEFVIHLFAQTELMC